MTRRRFYSVLILLMMILTAFCAGGCGGGSGGTAGTPPEQPPTPNPDPTPIVSPDPVPIPVPPPVDSPDPTPTQYTVTFDSNGGSPVASITVSSGGTIEMPDEPTREGYVFAGWYKDSEFREMFTFGVDGDKVTGDITLYAKWDMSDSSRAETALSKISIVFQDGDSLNHVTGNLTLPTSIDGIDISWSSDKPAVISNSGVVTRPKDSDVTVALTATATVISTATTFTASASRTRTFTAIVVHEASAPTPVQYTVTFNSNGGSSVVSVKVSSGGTIDKPTDPTRTGYTFSGWFKDTALSNPFTFGSNGDKITDNTTLYAKWAVNSYTVAFNSNGGSDVGSISANYGSSIDKPTDPTRTGYSFSGWFKDSGLSSPFTFGDNGDKITDNTTLYAKWTVNTYTVSFNSNGGSAVGSISANHGSTISKPADPTRTGYTFSGWFKDTALSIAFTFGSAGDKITDNIMLYAKWTVNSYTVTFNSNGGSAVNSISANHGSTIDKPDDPTRIGYTFSGWFKDSALSNPFSFGNNGNKITDDTTLYAKWTANSYTVSFNSNGGSAVSSISAKYGSTIDAPTNPTRSGYSFAGWFKDSAFTNPFTFGSAGDKITDNITLHVKWTVNTYTVSFNSNGGSAVGSVSASYGYTINKPVDPTRTGYSFAGWFKDSELSSPFTFGSGGDKITDNTTLYAKWTVNSYTVAFNSNGGSAVSSISANYGATIDKPADPIRAGYSFAGWFKDSAFTNPFTFGSAGDKITDNITLHAKWTVNTYTVSFNSNGGSAVGSISANHGSTISKPADPTRTGYSFAGWFKDSALSAPFSFGSNGDKITDNITLYAKWTVNSYTVSFNSNGGSSVGSISASHGSTINKPADPTKTGYSFAGWFKDSALSTTFTFGSNGDKITDNTTLYAKWTLNSYTISFNSNGGSAVGSISANHGSTINKPTDPTRIGYSFAGWFKDAALSNSFTFGSNGDKITDNITLYAKWTVNSYTVSFNSNGGSAVGSISVNHGSTINKPTDPARTGYTFAGWFKDSALSAPFTFGANGDKITDNITLYAKWTVNSYTVAFNSNGGSAVGSVSANYGSNISKPTDPTRTGYSFAGWFKDSALSVPFTFGSAGDKITDNITLYAKWNVNSYTVSFNSNGGSAVASVSANYGSTINKPTDPTRTGYSFAGWFKDSALSGPFTFGANGDKITDNITLHAKWTVNSYTVSFNSNGGSATGSISVNHGATINKPTDPTRTGYSFAGWFKDSALTDPFTFGDNGDKITYNITLYAKWTVNSYTVSFNSNGGSAVNPISANHGSTINKPDDPTRTGYSFAGWFKDSALSNPFSFGNNGDRIIDNITLYAKWTVNTYTITFKSNGGSAVGSIPANHGATISKPDDPTRTGYSFSGWFKDSALSAPFTFGSGGDKITDNITLYAKWTQNSYAVSFNSNGGSAVGSISANYGSTINKPADPTRTGYSFSGWFKDSGLSSPFTFGDNGDKITGNIILYAKWTQNSYTVTFNSNGGSAVSSISANHGSTINKPADPTRTGYSFAGWFKDSALSTTFTFGSAGDKITDNIMLYAKWTQNSYTVSFNSNGGSAIGSISASHGSTINKPADPTRTGYSFAGWFKDSALSTTFTFGANGDKITDNITLYAKWTVNSYTVVFNSNGGSAVGSISVNHGSTINKPTDPTRIGYSFAGWFKDAALSNSFTFGNNGDKITDNITLYAKWTVNSYTVAFNSNGGSAVSSISVNHDSTINKPTDPTRTGYTFSGWFKDTALSNPFTFGADGDKITDNITLYAKWTVNSYTVSFNSNGGSTVGSISATHGNTINKPADPTRTGYTFSGWFKDVVLSNPFTFGSNGDTIIDNTTLYAKWTVNSYTVSFNSNGGSAVSSISANHGATIDKPADPTRTGYSLAGWFKDSGLSSPFTFGSNGDKITYNTTLYAKWIVNSYTVSFNSNGGSAVSSISVNHGSTINKPADPTRIGYAFSGWFKDSALSEPFTFGSNGDKITDNTTLYAKWTVNSYTVTFNSNGGSAVGSISANHGATISKPDDPTRTGYSFSGWFKDSALSNPFTFGSNGDKITDNTTLYAKWTVNSYTVTFNSNGGSAVGSISVSHGSTIDKPADPTRTGYSFAGWFKDSALSAPFTFGSNGDKITDNTTLYAKWTVNSYTVSFNSNGGSAVDSISANYDSTIDKPTNPTRTGYSFAGWFKDSALSSPFTFGSAGDKITDNITLYAKWTLNTYTVTFNSNGGSAVSSISANHGSTIDKPDDPNKTGYSFAGWFKDSVLSSPFTFGNNGDTIIDNITLYAKWNLNSYTVTFNSNGGSAVDSILANYDSTIDKPTDPTRSGYSFSGWFKDSALSTPFSFGSNGDKITDNITLYAKWTLNTYTVTFNSNGGSAVSSISANHGSTIDKPADPTRTGYSFSGWFKDSALSNSFTFGNNGDTIIDNTTLYAKWTLNSYTVTFNSNGGSAVDSVSASHGSTIDKPDDPTKTGYSFAGWFKDSALSSLFTFGSAGDKITDDTTLYAKWTVNSYTVSFNSNGGSAVDSISANYGSTIDKPTDPTRSGYSFSGWFKDSALSNQFTFGSGGDKITEDTTLHAKWTLISYTVSFNSNGGSKVQDVIVQEGGTVSTPSNPTRTGYVFAGWYKDLDFSEMFTFGVDGDKVTSDITLYARWLDIDVLTAEYALSEVVIGYAKGDNPKYVTQNLTLPTKSGSADISWSSSSNAISTNGSVTRQSGDVDVTLTARASYNGKTSEAKTFELRVIKKRTRDNSSITAIEIGDASSGDIEITRNASGDITDIEGQYVSFDIQNADDALDAVTVLREELGIRSPDKELEVSVVTSDAYGAEYQFQQVYKGVEVFGRGLIASVNAKGNGDFMHSDILPSSLLASLDMTNLISSSDAENAVKSSYSGEVSADAFGVVIYSLESHSEKPVYAYIVKSYSISGDEYLAKNVFVNAVTKEIIVTASTTNNASRSTVLTTGNDEKGTPTLFEVTLGYDGRYQMYEPKSKVKMYFGSLLNPIVNDRNSWDDLVYYIATIFPDPIRINENGQHISAYVNVTEIVNWWKEKFSRNSFDGKGMQVNVVVHGSSVGFPLVGKGNANWNSALDAMYIGDAKMNQYSCAVAKDVLAHESAHAVMRYCTSLAFMCNIDTVIGRRKSAICEGYADIFACLKDYYEYGENSSRIWTIGEDMYHGEGYIRNVANPSDPPDPDANKQGIGHLRDYNDAREYHLNGVLIPHTAYLMQRYGLSWERLGKVWYKSMSMGLPITSNFQDVRRCVVWAAQKLNVSDNEMTIIEAAFDEVGIEAQKENSASKVRISGTLANGTMKTAYTGTLTVSGGTAPYTWSKSSGTLPSGLKLTTANTKATISGTPTKAGTYTFNIRVTDANKATAVKSFVVRIAEASTSSNETSSETGSPSEKTSKESSKKTSDQERTKSPDENQNSLPENYYLLENSPELPEGENTDVNLRAELHVVSEDIVEAYEGKDSDLVKVKAGAPLRFTVTHWGTEVYDIVVYVDEKALDSIMVSDEGEFTLPSEIVHDDFKVGVKAESIIGKRESEELYIIAE